ncbi:bifunctional 5,10-methylenetetrahydrofolate dehydrogenase/5,10-methenyltetrahydrofolate cyclohydrolase [Candidatus Gracilibacteria bacterium]|nr:bifunctional 5,10-methylenetetrahydrofolate dehydrogenase/5,10-methenyltetrahydrofolate cyclohydrolase [Candidatus Gracilibacteria bacterium]
MILDGKEVAKKIYEELKKDILKLEKKPKLGVILVGNNPSSIRYINQKQKYAKEVGIDFELFSFDENVLEKDLLEKINILNNDESISGYIVQLPLPRHIDEKTIINSISPKKDVDGFHTINQGKIVIGDESGLTPCTPSGILEIFKYYNIDLIGKNIVVVGRSNIVGKPIANMLINKQSTVTICNSKTKNIEFFTKNADIVILALGKPNFLTLDKIGDNTIVIDVGFTVIDGKIYGDACFGEILQNGNPITPVPGGVGVLTVAMLLKNTYKAFFYNSQIEI